GHLATRLKTVDWRGVLEAAAWFVIDAQRQGRPEILLRDAKQPPGAGVLLPPLLLTTDPIIIFGDGGTAKAYLGLALALSVHRQRSASSRRSEGLRLAVAYSRT